MSAVEVRRAMIRALRDELVGPACAAPAVQWHGPGSPLNGEEILRSNDRPRSRYGSGILFPNGMTYSGLLDDAEDAPPPGPEDAAPERPAAAGGGDGADESGEDEEPPALNSFVPGSLGISFLADVTDGLTVTARWATYDREDLPGLHDERDMPWFRRPGERTLFLAPRSGPVASWRESGGSPAEPELHVVDRPWTDGKRLITVTMLNARAARGAFIEDSDCFFQCGLEARPEGRSAFLPYPGRSEDELDEEELGLALLYRHRPTWAVGHGCAADWELSADHAQRVMTEVMPVVEQPPILPREALDGVNLSMLGLAGADDADLLGSCDRLAAAYAAWIDEQAAAIERLALGERMTGAGKRHLDQCREALDRIRGGIRFLAGDAGAMDAFRWMNRAMVEQRAHYGLSAEKARRRGWVKTTGAGFTPGRPYAAPDYPLTVRWRPFQLAFILMNLQGAADPAHAERALVDVIWFPTGGGKTEAYLGLAAWTMLRRRMEDPADGGVSILMRYTLRLLTAQQFQRAASLICALELIRRSDPRRLGVEPFTIGLWLGGGVTPNKDKDAVTALGELNAGKPRNPFVVLSCPWCGVEMGPRRIGGEKLPQVMGYRRIGPTVRFVCPDMGCPFSGEEGLPLEVVDERIYERPPTMIIGTVDKFAMLPFTPKARRLFGLDYGDVSPPDLIIQDELHLISGPLGSMVGHYETLIDALCTRADRRGIVRAPKIVASTATISRAGEQVRGLYAREARLFPPQALRAGDSFFAEERADLDGRIYVGALGSGLSSHIVAQIRLTAALLQAPATLRQAWPDDAVDPYWSLVTYFNSLRELGRASTLIHADIREYLRWVWTRAGIIDRPDSAARARRHVDEDRVTELTSRVPSEDIPATLERLFTGIPDRGAVDVCFATNMIQVGLDVPRLSLMLIVGQPKGASEYIQASSRVGRELKKPGLVVTNYNPFKPRDRSHYESFRSFHENIYRFVEPTSVTPFSLPVNERAVHALAVALVRCLDPGLRDRPGEGPDAALRQRIRGVILDRTEAVAGDEVERTAAVLDRFLDDWSARQPRHYGGFHDEDGLPLMRPAGRPWPDPDDEIPRATPTSMRSVDAESEARVAGGYGREIG
jgi:hypothetical protein